MRLLILLGALLVASCLLPISVLADDDVSFNISYTGTDRLIWESIEPGQTDVLSDNTISIMNTGASGFYNFSLTFHPLISSEGAIPTDGNMFGTVLKGGVNISLPSSGSTFELSLYLNTLESFDFRPGIHYIPTTAQGSYTGNWEMFIYHGGSPGMVLGLEGHLGEMSLDILPTLGAQADIGKDSGVVLVPGQDFLDYGVHSQIETDVTSGANGYYVLVYNHGNTVWDQVKFWFYDLVGPNGTLEVYDTSSNLAVRLVRPLVTTPWIETSSDDTVLMNMSAGDFGPGGFEDGFNITLFDGLPPRIAPYVFEFQLSALPAANGTFGQFFNITVFNGPATQDIFYRSGTTDLLYQQVSIIQEQLSIGVSYVDRLLQPTTDVEWLLPNVLYGDEVETTNILKVISTGGVWVEDLAFEFGNLSNGFENIAYSASLKIIGYTGANPSISIGDEYPLISRESVITSIDLEASDVVYLSLVVNNTAFSPAQDWLQFTIPFRMNASNTGYYATFDGVVVSEGFSYLLDITYVPSTPDALIFPDFGVDVESSNTMLIFNKHFSPISHITLNFTELLNGSESLDYEVLAVTSIDLNPYDVDTNTELVLFESEDRVLVLENPYSPGVPFLGTQTILSVNFIFLEAESLINPALDWQADIAVDFEDSNGMDFVAEDEKLIILPPSTSLPDIEITPEGYDIDPFKANDTLLITITARNDTYTIFFKLNPEYPLVSRISSLKVYLDLNGAPVAEFSDILYQEVELITITEPTTVFVLLEFPTMPPDQETAYDFKAKRNSVVYDVETLTIRTPGELLKVELWWMIAGSLMPVVITGCTWMFYSSVLIPQGIFAISVAGNKRKKLTQAQIQKKLNDNLIAVLFIGLVGLFVGLGFFSVFLTTSEPIYFILTVVQKLVCYPLLGYLIWIRYLLWKMSEGIPVRL